MAQQVINGIVQATVALALATIFYLGHVLIARTQGIEKETWSRWLGLHLPPNPREGWLFFAAFLVFGALMALASRFALPGYEEMAVQTPQHRIALMPLPGAAVAATVYAFVQTGFSEELLFRGVLGKRLMCWIGRGPGNIAQALIFGLIHAWMVLAMAPAAGMVGVVVAGGLVTAMAWVAGWAMEVRGEGSIFFPWLMHSAANLVTILVYIVAPVGS